MNIINHSLRKYFLILRISLFLIAISLPGMLLILQYEADTHLDEKRTLAPLPKMPFKLNEFASFPGKFEKYFNDHFGLRALFVRIHNRLTSQLLNLSQNQVTVGSNGWLYLTRATVDNADYTPFSEVELRTWKESLETKRDWLTEQGIPYLFVIGANKTAIYPEYFPGYESNGAAQTRQDQLIAYLKINSDIDLVDVRPALLEARKKNRLFLKTDSHLNTFGAYIAYREIISAIGNSLDKEIKPSPIGRFRIEYENGTGGNLANMLGLQVDYEEEYVRFNRKEGDEAPKLKILEGDDLDQANIASPWVWGVTFANGKDLDAPKALFFGDSYIVELFSFLRDHFSHSSFAVANAIDSKFIFNENPDIVVQELIEFKLAMPPENDSYDIMEFHSRRFFNIADKLIMKNADELRNEVNLVRGLSWTKGQLASTLKSTGRKALALLPAVEAQDNKRTLVRITIYSARDTHAYLFYGVPDNKDFSKKFSVERRIHAGKNELTFEIVHPEFNGKLALLPGKKAGVYAIDEFEVRVIEYQ